jgi:hypothetical protein
MTLTLNLTPEEERRVRKAAARGFNVEAMLHALIAGLPDAPETQEDRTLALIQQWREEDATDDPEELARRDSELAEFKANMNANRTLSGEEPIY